MGKESVDVVGLTLGFIVFFADLIVLCIFSARVRASFDKQIIDEDWQTANDYWLKLSRVSGVMFSIFHIGTMSIIISQCTNMDKHILNNHAIAHLYWLLESLWTFNVNSAIVLITMRCYRVYKTTKTKFTPLKDWISEHELAIEYFIWITYILIILFIIIQYFIIISSAPNQYFSVELSLINALRMFATATILSLQLMIACFFFYIAHKSQQQTNWNEQSKAIILKQTAKLAFIVIFLALIVGIIFYHAIWYLVHIHTNRYALNAPFTDTGHRISWSMLEFLTFWLILYLTRLRSPPSDDDKTLPSKTSTKPFLMRALSVKNRKEELRQQKLQELEERKKAFRERERRKRKQYTYHHKPTRTADNTFNTLVIKTVARHEREKKFNTTLLSEITQKKQQKSQQHTKMEQIHKELKERNIKAIHRYNQTDPAGFHDALQKFSVSDHNPHKEVRSLDILEEEDDGIIDDFMGKQTHEAPVTIATTNDESPIEPQPDIKQQLTLNMMDASSEISDSPPIPQENHVMDTLPKISVTPTLHTSSSGYALTPRNESKNKQVAVVLTPHAHHHSSVSVDNLKPTVSLSDIETETDADTDICTDDDAFLTDDTEEEDVLQALPDIQENHSYNNNRNIDKGVTPFQSIIAKLGSVFTPRMNADVRNEQKQAKTISFPNVRVLKEADTNADDSHSGLKLQFDVTASTHQENTRLKPRSYTDPMNAIQSSNDSFFFQANEQKEGDLEVVGDHANDIENDEKHMQHIVDIYLDAFKKEQATKDDIDENEGNECKEHANGHKLSAFPPTPSPHSLPITPQQPEAIITKINKRSSITQVVNEGIFHNVVHLRPTLLKRSHSDPDIRSRNEIWDQLLSAFKEMNDGPLPISPEADVHTTDNMIFKRPSFTNDSSGDSYYYTDRNLSINEEHDREISSQTQLSATERERGFHLFDFFNNKHELKLDETHTKTKSKRKIKSDKMKKVKKERDSLKLPDSSATPDLFQNKKSLNQPLSVRLPHDKSEDTAKAEKKQKRKRSQKSQRKHRNKSDTKQSKSDRKQSNKSDRKQSNKSDRKQSNKSDRKQSNKSDRKQSKSLKNGKQTVHRRSAMLTSDIVKTSNHKDPQTKKRKKKAKKKKMHKLRMKQKQQTKQWMDNVHQVF